MDPGYDSRVTGALPEPMGELKRLPFRVSVSGTGNWVANSAV
jgi:hypothetical protein